MLYSGSITHGKPHDWNYITGPHTIIMVKPQILRKTAYDNQILETVKQIKIKIKLLKIEMIVKSKYRK